VPERYSFFIKTGSVIKFTVGTSAKEYEAKIYAIEPKVDEVTRMIQLRAISSNLNREILPGTFARITLILGGRQDALMVPTQSIVPILKGQQVYVYRSGKAEAIKVETGTRTDTAIQIVSGLNPGDTVLTTGIMQLRPGVDVKLLNLKLSN
jgi:membrane fusion protein (multidrug efflux system)